MEDTVKAENTNQETPATASEELRNEVISAIRECYDPEIPVNVYDLGLIYDVKVSDSDKIDLVMTLTSPHCPVAEILPEQVKSRVELVGGVGAVSLDLTWEPPWTPDMMSEAAKLELGFM